MPVNKQPNQTRHPNPHQDRIILGRQVKRQLLTQPLRDMLQRVKDSEYEKRANTKHQSRLEQGRAIDLVEGRVFSHRQLFGDGIMTGQSFHMSEKQLCCHVHSEISHLLAFGCFH
jgi:hypothetical protein